MSGEAPAYLSVGTAVSAKYRGAFCEAKVKLINKKLVKCRVTFKDNTNGIVPDEFVKGNLKIGSSVEAKHPEHGAWQEGVISKLNDASVYTVLFDDGDEKTLRRSSLCLQGEKHFHESETLDHLPLTDPENFGTPVVRDRTKRKRPHPSRPLSASRLEDEEGESSSGSEIFKRLRREEPDNAVGKVVIVETSEKRKNLWFPALIVDPSCTKDAPNRTKDHIVTRSFKDNKYYTVSESSWRLFSSKDHIYKGDVISLKSAVEKAVLYIETGQLPPTWDFNLLKSKEKIEGESEDTETSDESSDDEYDEQKDAWLASLHKFMEERGTPINKPPVLGYRDLNLYKLYKLVQDLGGCKKVTDKQQWRYIASKMGIPIHNTTQSYNIKASYNKYLFAFEEHNRKLGPGFSSVMTRPRRRSSYERWTPVPPVPIRKDDKKESEKEKKKEVEEKPEPKEEPEPKPEPKPAPKKKTRRKTDTVEQEKEAAEVEEEKNETPTEEKDKQTPRSSGKRAAAKSASKEEPETEKDEEDLGRDFEVGERVKVQYGRGRTHKVYEAKIVDVKGNEKSARYAVHYLGWNIRYDETVNADRIVTSLDKRKEKRLARIKAAQEKDNEQQQKELELELERKEKERKEKERKEKERKEKEAEKVKREKEKLEKEERERKEKEERDRKEKEKREKKEREELEKKLKKEREESEKKQKKEQEERERQEKKERETKEKEERERKEKEEELQRQKAEAELLAAEENKTPKKEEKKTDEEKGKVASKGPSKRGRPPSLSPKTSTRPASPRVSGGGRRSPATSFYPTRSLRSDRNSLSESPFANGLEAIKIRGRRGSSASRTKTEESEEESEGENLTEDVGIETTSPAKIDTKTTHEEHVEDKLDDPKPLEPVPEEVAPENEEPLDIKVDSEMPVFDMKEGKDAELVQPPKSPPRLKKEGDIDEEVKEEKEEMEVKEENKEVESKKGKRKSKKAEKEVKQDKEGGKKTSKKRHSKDLKQEMVEEALPGIPVEEAIESTETIAEEVVLEAEETKEDGQETEERPETAQEGKKKVRKRGRKSLDEKNKEKGEKKAKKKDGEGESGKRGRRKKKKHEEEEAGEDMEQEEVKTLPEVSSPEEDKKGSEEVSAVEEEEAVEENMEEMEAATSENRMLTASITTPPTTPESSSLNEEDEGKNEEASLSNDSDSMIDMASSGSVTSVKNEHLEEEISSNNSIEKESEMVGQAKRGRPNKESVKKRRKHSSSISESTNKIDNKSKRKKGSRRRTTSVSSGMKAGPNSSDTDESSNGNVKGNFHQEDRVPRPCKYNFSVDVSHMNNPDDRIAIIQKQLIDLRKIYLQLKSEVSTIDRRRKRFRRKEREAQAAALMAATSLADISNSAPATSLS